MLTVSLIEDDAGFCELLCATIRSSGQLRLLSWYQSAEEALQHLPKEKPDAALVDVKMPGMDGVECVRRFRAMVPPLLTHFIILTHFDADDLVWEAFKAGAHGYLLKDAAANGKICEAIAEAVNGGVPMTPPIARKVVHFFEHAQSPVASMLSTREQEVLKHLSDGMAYKEIAAELSISINTVRKHLGLIYQKLHVHSRTAAAMQYTRQHAPRANV